ncbi:hypothetical protein CCP1ISM_50010 [Azospirillaceae bacterium]
MPFDITTAQPIEDINTSNKPKGKFDITTAKPVKGFDISSAKPVNEPFLPRNEEVETDIAQRPDIVGEYAKKISSPNYLMKSALNPIQATSDIVQGGQGLFQRGEAAVANPLLEIQRGQFGSQQTGHDVAKSIGDALMGKREAQLGDIPLKAGVPKPISSAIGFMSLLGVPGAKPIAEETGNKVIKGTKNLGTNIGKEVDIMRGKNIPKLEEMVTIEKNTEARAIEDERLKLQSDIDSLTKRIGEHKDLTKTKIENLKSNLQKSIEQAAVEIKQKFPQMRKDISKAYGEMRDKILGTTETNKVQLEHGDIDNFINNADNEIIKEGITSGKAFNEWQKFKENYSGIKESTNPELKQLYDALGLKNPKQIQNAGIDLSRIDIGQSSRGAVPEMTKGINAKQFIEDIKKIENAISAKAKGATETWSNEDRLASIVQKHTDNFLQDKIPALKKLRQVAAPIIDLKNKVALDVKTGNQFDIKDLTGLLEKSVTGKIDSEQARMLEGLQKGKTGFTKGVGNVTKTPKMIADLLKQRQGELEMPPTDLAKALEEKQHYLEMQKARKPSVSSALSQQLEEAKAHKLQGLSPQAIAAYFAKRKLYNLSRGKF